MSLKDDLPTDLDTFLDTDEFAVTATIGAASVKGIFDAPFQMENLETGQVETTAPSFLCKTSDVSTIAHGSTVAISSVTYYVIGIHPDGTGLTKLMLSKVNVV